MNIRRGRIGQRTRWSKRGVVVVAVVAAMTALGIGSSGAYFTGLFSTYVQPATTSNLPPLSTARAVTNGANTDLTWSAAPALDGFGPSPTVTYTVKRNTMNAFSSASTAVTVASGVSGLSATDVGTATVPSLGNREATAISGWGDLQTAVIGGKPYRWGTDGAGFSQSTPTLATGIPEQVISVTTGGGFACALTVSGRVFCVGLNDSGQLGDGTTTDSSTFVEVASYWAFKGESVIQVSAGAKSVCAVGDRGTVACWGKNDYGQLGDGTTTNRSIPTTVATTAGAVPTAFATFKPVQVAGGDDFFCALKGPDRGFPPNESTTVACWGRGGSVVDGAANTAITQPVDKVDTSPSRLFGITKIKAAGGTVCVLNGVTNGPNVACWGSNANGVLGDGTSTDSSSPVTVLYGGAYTAPTGFTDLTVGQNDGCITRGVEYACWGRNSDGQLGIGSSDNNLDRLQTVRDLSGAVDRAPITAIGASRASVCAVVGAGGLACWGRYSTAQNNGLTSPALLSPTIAVLAGAPAQPTQQAKAISAGADAQFSAAILNGKVYLWGRAGDAANNVTPVLPIQTQPTPLAGFPDTVTRVAAGNDHVCASTTTNEIWCVGRNASGELGNGTTTDSPSTAVRVVDGNNVITGKTIVDLQAGVGFTCALFADGSVACWGANDRNQLGAGSSSAFSLSPVLSVAASPGSGPFSGAGKKPVLLAVSRASVCLGKNGAGVACWGGNQFGELGGASVVGANSAAPVDLVENPSLGTVLGAGPVRALDGGNGAFCMVASSGDVYCWGNGAWGVLGDGGTTSQKDLVSTGLAGSAVTVGSRQTCIVRPSGAGRCWGANQNGELGNSTTGAPGTVVAASNSYTVAGLASGSPIVALSAGAQHTCVLLASGALSCWGYNAFAATGQKTTTPTAVTVATAVLVNATAITGALERVCADGSATVNNGTACPTPANLNTWYQVTYQVAGADKWVSAPLSVIRDPYPSCDAVFQNAASPTSFAYTLKNGSGSVEADARGRSGVDGTYSGSHNYPAVSPVACASGNEPPGTSYTPDGNGDYITVGGAGGATAAPNVFSMGVWFRAASPQGKLMGFGNFATGMSYWYDRQFYIDTDGRLFFGKYPNVATVTTTPVPVTDGKWHLATATYSDQGGMRLYLDGVLVDAKAYAMTPYNFNGYWRIGGDNLYGWTSGSAWSDASMRYAAVWPSVLTPAEIERQYLVGAPR